MDRQGMPKCYDFSLNDSMPRLTISLVGYGVMVFRQMSASIIESFCVGKNIFPAQRKLESMIGHCKSIGIQRAGCKPRWIQANVPR